MNLWSASFPQDPVLTTTVETARITPAVELLQGDRPNCPEILHHLHLRKGHLF